MHQLLNRKIRRKLLSISLLAELLLLFPLSILPTWSATDNQQPNAPTDSQSGLSGLNNLDLSSSTASIQFQQNNSLTIQVGGTLSADGSIQGGSQLAINHGQLLTPAQYIAVHQVLAGGVQNILLNSSGNAVGGFASIQAGDVSSLSALVIPQNVALGSIGFGTNNPLNVSGAVSIAGSLYALQTAPDIGSVLNLGGLNIASGGLLSGYLPSTTNLFSNLFASSGLTLNVLNNIVNSGTITSPGVLNINAGGSIYNTSIGNITANIQAQTLNIISGTGNIYNSGLMSAMNAININTLDPNKDIFIDNRGGTLQSILDSINIRDSTFALKQNLNIVGGDLIANNINLNSGRGTINVDINEVSGIVNVSSGAAYVGANSPLVSLGNITVLDDPIFYNSLGGFNLTGTIATSGGDLAILSAGDITYTGALTTTAINTTQTSGRAGDVYLVAGYSINVNGNPASNSCCTPGLTTGTITLNTAGAPGGSISIPASSSSSAVAINAFGTGTGQGGNVSLYAFANGATGGSITLGGNRDISTSGGPTADVANINGNITLIAPNSIAVRNISTTQSTSNAVGTGTINIYTAQPFLPGGAVDFSVNTVSGRSTITTSAQIGPGAAVGTAPVLSSSGTVSATTLRTAGANIEVFSSSDQTYTGTVASNSVNTATSGGNILLTTALGNLSLITVTADARTTGSGGNISLIAGNSITSSGTISSAAAGASDNNGGEINAYAGTNFNLNANDVTIPSASSESATGGALTLGAITTTGIVGGNGGNITLAAFQGTGGSPSANSGMVDLGGHTITTSGGASGKPGSITVLSGDTNTSTGTAQISLGVVNETLGSNVTGNTERILIATARPTLATDLVLPYSSVSAGSNNFGLATSATLLNGDIVTSSITTNGRSVTLLAGGNIRPSGSVFSVTTTRTAGSAGGGSVLLASQGGRVDLGTGTIVTNGGTSGAGGNVTLIAGGSSSASVAGDILLSSISSIAIGSGDGGSIYLLAGTQFSASNTAVTVTSASPESAAGGTVTLSSTGTPLRSTGVGSGNGGDIILVAYNGTTPVATNSGTISLNSASTIQSQATGTGRMGNINIFAGDTNAATGTAQLTVGAVNLNGGGSGASTGQGILLANTRAALSSNISFAYSTAAPSGGTFGLAANPTLLNGDIAATSSTTSGRNITFLSAGNIVANSTSLALTTTGIAGNPNGGNVLLASQGGQINLGTGAITANALSSGTGSGGNIVLIASGSSSASAAGDIALASTVSTAVTTGNGGNIYILAGTQFTVSNTAITVSSTSPESAAGGKIALSSAATVISTVGAGTGGNGGDIILVAYNGSTPVAANSGTIIFNNSTTIQSQATGTGRMGSINIFSGDTNTATGTAQLTIGNMATTGGGTGASTGQSILLANTRAALSSDISFALFTATPSGGTFGLAATPTLLNGDISVGNVANTAGITSSGRNITILAGGNILPNNSAFLINANGVTGNPNGGNILLASQSGRIDLGTRTITANGLTGGTGAGGNVTVIAGGNVSTPTPGDINIGSISTTAVGSGNGGSIYLLAGTQFSASSTGVTVSATTPESAAGGRISLPNVGNVCTSTGAGSGDGGDIVLVAYDGTAPVATNSGTITCNTSSNMLSSATGTGRSGGVTIFAGDTNSANGTAQLTIGTINLSGSGASTGQSVLLANSRANLSADVSFSFSTSSPAGGTFGLATSPVLLNGDISISSASNAGITSTGHNVTILAGGNIVPNLTGFTINSTGAAGNPNGGNILVASQSGRINLAAGSIAASGLSSGGASGNVTVVASGNSGASVGGDILLTSLTASAQGTGDNSGGNVFLAAGALFSVSNTAITIDSTNAESATGGQVTASGNFSTVATGNGSAGNMSIVAYQGTGTATSNSGTISTGTFTATAPTTGTGRPGSIMLMSGDTNATTGTAQLTTGSINMAGGSGTDTGQNLFAANSRPTLSANTTITYSSAIPTGGTYGLASSPTLLNGDLQVGNVATNGRAITLLAGGNIIATSNMSSSRSTGAGNGGAISIASQNGAINFSSGTGNISTSGLTAGNGGNVILIAGGSTSASVAGNITLNAVVSTGVGSGAGGNIYLLAGSQFSATNTGITISNASAESAAGGKISLTGTGTAIGSISTASSGNAGDIIVVAYNGATPVAADSGTITLATTSTVQSSPGGTGHPGNITILAGDTNSATGTPQITLNSVTMGGSGSGASTGESILLANTRATLSADLSFDFSTVSAAGGTFGLASNPILLNGDIAVASITSSGRNITVLSGGNIIANGAALNITATGITGAPNGGNILLASQAGQINLGTGTITSNGLSSGGNGGNIMLIAQGNSSASVAGNILLGSIIAAAATSGTGGSIYLLAGTQFSATNTGITVLSATPESGAGGKISVSNSTTAVNTAGAGSSGNAGSVTVVAYNGTSPVAADSGTITFDSNSTLLMTGTGTGQGGNLSVFSGDTTATTGTPQLTIGAVSASGTGTGKNVLLANARAELSSNTTFTYSTALPTGGTFGLAASPTYLNGDISATNTITTSGSASLYASGNITVGTISAGDTLTITSTAATTTVNTSLSTSDQIIVNGANISTLASATMNAVGINLTSTAGTITIGDTNTITSSADLTLSSTSQILIGQGSTLSAGTLASGAPTTGTLATSDIQSAGNLSITSTGNIGISSSQLSPTSFSSAGSNLAITSSGNIALGTGGLSMSASGGNLTVLAQGTVSGSGSDNNFTARSLGTASSFTGGGIEVGSGLTSSTNIADYFASRTNAFIQPAPGALGPNVIIYNNGLSGLVAANTSGGGTIDVGSPDPSAPSIINVFGGAVIFDALGAGSSVNFRSNSTVYAFGLPVPVAPSISPTTTTASATLPFFVVLPNIDSLISISEYYGVPTDRLNRHIPLNQQYADQILSVNNQMSWFITQKRNEPFIWEGDNETIIISQEGSKFARFESRTMVLDHGRILVFVGKEDLTIDTVLGLITIPARSSAIIDNTFPNVVRVISLSGTQSKVYLADGEQLKSVESNMNEELVISNNKATNDELVPADGITRQRDNNAQTINALKVEKNKISRKEIANKDPLLQNPSLQNKPLVDALKTECQKDGGLLPFPGRSLLPGFNHSANMSSRQVQKSFFRPVAFRSGPSVNSNIITPPKLSGLNTATALIKHNGSAQISPHSNIIELKHGEILVFADQPTTVTDGQSTIKIGTGSMALIDKSDSILTIRNLWEQRNNSVHCQFGSHHLDFGAGQECIIAQDDISITAAFSRDSVGRRRIQRVSDNKNNRHVSTCEISLVTLLTSSQLLNKMVANKEPDDTRLTNKILKMAACIHQVTRSHGSYSSLSR